eukprot:664170-Alexandrium_andersonii.AAC.1
MSISSFAPGGMLGNMDDIGRLSNIKHLYWPAVHLLDRDPIKQTIAIVPSGRARWRSSTSGRGAASSGASGTPLAPI